MKSIRCCVALLALGAAGVGCSAPSVEGAKTSDQSVALDVGATSHAPDPAPDHYARTLLTAVVLPHGVFQTGQVLAPALKAAPTLLGSNDLIDENQLWFAPMTMASAMSFLRQHIPTGMHWTSSGQGNRAGRIEELDLELAPLSLPIGIEQAQLVATVAPVGSAGSEIRLDAQAIWIPERSPSERIPADTTRLVITEYGIGPTTSVTITDAADVAAFAKTIDGLIAVPTETCNGPAPDPDYELAFSASQGQPPAFVAAAGSCPNTMTVTTNGQAEPSLRPTSQLLAMIAAHFRSQ